MLYQNSLDQLIEQTMSMHFDRDQFKDGEFDASAVGTFVDALRRETDDYFQNTVPVSRAYVRSTTDGAAPKGEERTFTDWVQTGGAGVIAPDWSAAPAVGDTYCIMYEYSWDEVKKAINQAIDRAAPRLLIDKIDETTLVLQSDIYEYPVPAGFIYIYRLVMADSDGHFHKDPIPAQQWGIIHDRAIPKIQFKQMPAVAQPDGHYWGALWAEDDMTAARATQIQGLARQPVLTGDGDLCYLSPVYVCAQAAAFLHAKQVRRSDNEPDEHRTQYQICQAIADREFNAMRTQFPPDCKRVA